MDWITKMNAAVRYAEDGLDGEIDYAEAARLAGCSAYHFQRVFSYMAGTTFAEYVRRRRLTMAAFDLQSGSERVIDVALKYGYDSPTSFARAFQQFHGMTPSEARTAQKTFTSYPPLSFQIIIKGVAAMNYRIENKDAIRIVGVKITTKTTDGNNHEIPEFWAKTYASGVGAKISELINQEPAGDGLYGVCCMLGQDTNEFDYYIAAPTDKPVPEGMTEYVIPASQYAVFESVGPMPDAIQAVWTRVFTEWLPNSGYEYGPGNDIELYSDGDTSAADYKCWCWLPIVKK